MTEVDRRTFLQVAAAAALAGIPRDGFAQTFTFTKQVRQAGSRITSPQRSGEQFPAMRITLQVDASDLADPGFRFNFGFEWAWDTGVPQVALDSWTPSLAQKIGWSKLPVDLLWHPILDAGVIGGTGTPPGIMVAVGPEWPRFFGAMPPTLVRAYLFSTSQTNVSGTVELT